MASQNSICKCILVLQTGMLEFSCVGKKFPLPMVRLEKIAQLGIVHREISNERQGAFNVCHHTTVKPRHIRCCGDMAARKNDI